MERTVSLDRRLANFRAAARPIDPPLPIVTRDLADRLAHALDGEVVAGPSGTVVRCEVPSRSIPVDRDRLASLPGQPPPHAPLVCLDTETTGLATAAGTVAFLVGVGWWSGDRFHQVQLLLPDHADEPALLDHLARLLPADAWLVTYNGRGFDWPLLVTRFRMARRDAPRHAGHLDLLPIVRRLFRHRMEDARLRTAEAHLLGIRRVGDVDGWEIPGRYLTFLRGGPAAPLIDVVRHNDQDVRSLAWLVAHLDRRYADPAGRAAAPRGDLAGLARAFTRERRLGEALACLDGALARDDPESASPVIDAEDWTTPEVRPDFGGSLAAPTPASRALDQGQRFAAPWTDDRLLVDRAHVLRRMGRFRDAASAWDALTYGSGRVSILAAIELAKLREHRLRDVPGALAATDRGLDIARRRRRLGRPEPALEADLDHRRARLLIRRRRWAA